MIGRKVGNKEQDEIADRDVSWDYLPKTKNIQNTISFIRGEEGYYEGKSSTDNPYPAASVGHENWTEGWKIADHDPTTLDMLFIGALQSGRNHFGHGISCTLKEPQNIETWHKGYAEMQEEEERHQRREDGIMSYYYNGRRDFGTINSVIAIHADDENSWWEGFAEAQREEESYQKDVAIVETAFKAGRSDFGEGVECIFLTVPFIRSWHKGFEEAQKDAEEHQRSVASQWIDVIM